MLFAVGDIAAQQGVEKKGLKKHDPVRTGRMALYGGCEYNPSVLFSSDGLSFLALLLSAGADRISLLSRLRPRSHHMVWLVVPQGHAPQQARGDVGAARLGPAHLCACDDRCLSQQHGHHGGC